MTIYRSVLRIVRNVSNKSGRENQNKHHMTSTNFFRKIVPCMTMWGKNDSQQLATDLYPEPHKANTHPPTLFLSDPFQYSSPTHP